MTIIQYSSTVDRDWGFWPKILLQKQLNVYISTVRQYWLGIAKLKNVFKAFLNPSFK